MQGLPRLTTSHALFLDFDGTLVDIAPQPDAVRVTEGLVPALDTLNTALQGALAIVTGRALADVDFHLAPLLLTAACEHGAQYRLAHGGGSNGLAVLPSPDLMAAAQQLRRTLQPYPELLIEEKTAGLALHYRNAEALAPLCHTLMNELARTLPGMELLHGKCVLELKPAGPSKGRALQDLMRLPRFAGRTPLMIGDDVTDESAFVAVQHLGGLGVKVGPGSSNAQGRIATPARVREWLLAQAMHFSQLETGAG